MTEKRFDVGNLKIQDTAPKGRVYLLDMQGGVNALCSLINGLNDKSNRLEKENEQLKTTISRLIEQNRKNNDLLVSDIRLLEKALWCPNCTRNIKRLKELKKEFEND